jgi:hypothetical protein
MGKANQRSACELRAARQVLQPKSLQPKSLQPKSPTLIYRAEIMLARMIGYVQLARNFLIHRFRGSKHIDIISEPRPEERAPRSGLPDFSVEIGDSRFRFARLEGRSQASRANVHRSRRRASHGSSG